MLCQKTMNKYLGIINQETPNKTGYPGAGKELGIKGRVELLVKTPCLNKFKPASR